VQKLKGGVFYQVLALKGELSFESFPSNRVLFIPPSPIPNEERRKSFEPAPLIDEKMVEIPTLNIENKNKEKTLVLEQTPTVQPIAQQIQLENIIVRSILPYTNFSGAGFVEISTTENKQVEIPVYVQSEGTYYLRFRYSNGSGAWNTDNSCAFRSLYVNGAYKGAMVFPQRGTHEWSDWGFSNGYQVNLKAGESKIRLVFEEWNNNMNVDVNRAMLDYLEVIKMD
jgi:hypothetical protein